jgi:hypothetical protein
VTCSNANYLKAQYGGIWEHINMEFRVDVADISTSLCVECGKRILSGENRVRSFKRSSLANRDTDCFYHSKCWVKIHSEQLKKMVEDIVEVLMVNE